MVRGNNGVKISWGKKKLEVLNAKGKDQKSGLILHRKERGWAKRIKSEVQNTERKPQCCG